MSTTVEYRGRSGVDETAAERQQRLRREREKRSPSVQVSQPKSTKSVKYGTQITGKELRRKKTKEKEEESSWMSKWRPKLTWFL